MNPTDPRRAKNFLLAGSLILTPMGQSPWTPARGSAPYALTLCLTRLDSA
jgi:hypothetical protein